MTLFTDNHHNNAMSLFQFAGRLPGRGQGPAVLDQLQVGPVHHHHLRQPGGASEDHGQVPDVTTFVVVVLQSLLGTRSLRTEATRLN